MRATGLAAVRAHKRSGGFLFPVTNHHMLYDARCPRCGNREEIEKPMKAPMPPCEDCGARLVRVYSAAVPVHYRAAGFYSTETSFDKQIGPERAAKFRRDKEDVERRAKAGKLTDYEKALEVA